MSDEAPETVEGTVKSADLTGGVVILQVRS